MISLSDIRTTRERISDYTIETPLIKNRILSEELGANLYLKLELFQETGSFKPRGAFNQILHQMDRARDKGVVAFSGGNFAQAVAYAGGVLDLKTVIFMPTSTPANYVNGTRSYGAEVRMAPDIPALIAGVEACAAEGYVAVHPFDDPYQMAGTGTIGLEILEQAPQVTDVFVSVGGGGLIAGIISGVKALKPEVRVWGVETEGADSMARALEAGKVVNTKPDSLAKTLCSPFVSETALRICEAHLAKHILVSDAEAIKAQQFLLEQGKVLTELAASCTLAAARKVSHQFQASDHVVLVLCGGNESLENMLAYRKLA